jgi:hypothetical protein
MSLQPGVASKDWGLAGVWMPPLRRKQKVNVQGSFQITEVHIRLVS